MKKSSLIINGILLVAVAVLYVLYFTRPKVSEKTPTSQLMNTSEVSAPKVVYVNIDTLLANYDMFADYQSKLNEKQKSSEAKLNAQSQTWQNKVTNYQNNLKRGLVTRSEAQKIEQQLSQEQQGLVKLKNDLSSKLMEEQQVSYRKVMFSIVDFLKGYGQSHHYQYVFSTTVGGNLLYADKNFEVTKEVMEGLNLKYKSVRDSVLKAK